MTDAAAFSKRDGAGGVVFDGKMWMLGGWGADPAGGAVERELQRRVELDRRLTWTQVRPELAQGPRRSGKDAIAAATWSSTTRCGSSAATRSRSTTSPTSGVRPMG